MDVNVAAGVGGFLFTIIMLAISLLIQYFIVRFGVKHGVLAAWDERDARKSSLAARPVERSVTKSVEEEEPVTEVKEVRRRRRRRDLDR